MSKIKIEDYRGHEIFYDEDLDKFTVDISIEDKYKKTNRISLKAARQEIDNFAKANLEFKPFKIMYLEEFAGECDVRNVIGVRKDGCLVIEYEKYDRKFKNYVKSDDKYYAKMVAKYNSKLLDIEKEWNIHSKIWDSKKKELKEKAKPFIEPIDWEFINSFKAEQ